MIDLHLCDLSAFVISSQDGDSVLETNLQGDEESHGLDRVVSSIDVVSHEQVVSLGRLSSNFEKFTQVVELTMDISTDGHGSLHCLHVRLFDKDFFSLIHFDYK